METQNHLGDGFDAGYLSAEDRDEMVALASRAIGAATRLHQYLKHAKTPRRRRTKNREP
jgi:hypothetical protein